MFLLAANIDCSTFNVCNKTLEPGYEQQISKGKSHNVAIRSLAFKWIRILFRCWKNRKPYDESTYLNALKKRGSPLLKGISQV